MRTRDKNEFLKDAKSKNNKIRILGEYVNSHTKIKVQCKKCGKN